MLYHLLYQKKLGIGENNLPLDHANKSTVVCLQDLHKKRELVPAYSDECFVYEQTRHLKHNKRTRTKSFVPGHTGLTLKQESTASHALRVTWQGSVTVKKVISSCCHIVDI